MGSYRFFGLLILMVFFIGGCSSIPNTDVFNGLTMMPCDEDIPWKQAIEILRTGQVESIMQLHSLEVSFVLENGCRIRTIEPHIDDIFDEVRKCGELCTMIILATE